MTIADHLRAVLGVLDAKAFRTPAQQDVIEAARTALEQRGAVAYRSFPNRLACAMALDNLGRNLTIAAAHAVADDREVTAKRMDALRKFDTKSNRLVQTESEFESAMSEVMQAIARGSVERDTANMRFALHQAIIAQDVASVPQERAKSECAPPPGVTQERAATGTVERSGACDIVARSLVKGRETQKLALSTYGREAQQDQAIEECAELIVALRHYQRGVGSLGELQGEIADVLVTVMTLAIQYGDEAIAACVDYKLDRLRKRLGGR